MRRLNHGSGPLCFRLTRIQANFHEDYEAYTEDFRRRLGKPGEYEQPRKKRMREVFIPWEHRKYDIAYIGIINEGSTRG
eukprot:scaffold565063_cov46-Prasinocladus_malaysianus.AAC.1